MAVKYVRGIFACIFTVVRLNMEGYTDAGRALHYGCGHNFGGVALSMISREMNQMWITIHRKSGTKERR